MNRRLLLSLFAISGATGLVYEVLWIRRLSLIFGSTTLAVSTVLASFMGGLALGSWLLGRYADRHPERSLRVYALLELGVGTFALCIPLLLRGAAKAYLLAYPKLQGAPQIFLVLQFLLVSAVLIAPTAFMGGTLPVLVRYSVRQVREVGVRVGALYGANTIGAAAGTLFSTYVLLPYVGIAKSELLTAAANLILGAVVWSIAVRRRAAKAGGFEPVEAGAPTLSMTAAASRVVQASEKALLVGIGLSGFAAFVYEVVWSRVLAFVLGSSIYAFGMVLLVFLLGISLGATIFARLKWTGSAALRGFAVAQAGLAVAGLLVLDRLPHLPVLFLRLFPAARDSFLALQTVQLAVVASLLLVPAILFGAAVPAVIAATTGSAGEAGSRVGRVVVWNTAGNVLGAVLAGFVLIPTLGLSAAFVVAIVASALAAVVTLSFSTIRRRGAIALAAVGAAAVAVLLPAWAPEVLATGVGFFAEKFATPAEWREAVASLDLLFYKDGVSTTISVDRSGPYIYYRSNGKTDASTTPGDMANQLYLGHLPMLLHPKAQDVFVLGLGTGVTAASIARYPVRSIDIVDIEPASRDASALFAARNRNVLGDPRVRLILADGRNALLARSQTYDIIVSDPSDVWVAGVGNLFTQEFYRLARTRLRPGGVVVQWFHMHALLPQQLRLIVATFRRVFPHSTLWRPNQGDVILVGTADPRPWSFQRIERAFQTVPGVARDFASVGVGHPLSLFGGLVLPEADLRAYTAGVTEIHSDDLPVIEFFSPRALYRDTVDVNDRGLQERQHALLPAMPDFEPASWTADARYRLGLGYVALGRAERGLLLLEAAVRANPTNTEFLSGLAASYRLVNRDDLAVEYFRRALSIDAGHSPAVVGVASLLQNQGLLDQAEATLRSGSARNPDDLPILEATATLLFTRQRYSEALPLLFRAREKNRQNGSLALLAGQSLLALKRENEARTQFREALELAPTNPGLQRAAAQSLLALGDASGAAAGFGRAASLEPRNRDALVGLYESARRTGDASTAAAAQERLRQLQ